MKLSIKIFLHTIIILSFLCNTGSARNLKNNSIKDSVGDMQSAADANSSQLFEILFSEAKDFYVEALIGEHFADTTEIKFCLDQTLEIVSEIRELDSLSFLQREDYRRFCEKLNADFKTKFAWINGDEGSYLSSDVEVSLGESLNDTIDIGTEKLVILEDKEGRMPLLMSPKIKKIIKYYQTKQKNNFQEWLQNADYYEEAIRPILKKEGLPDDIFYLALIESGFKTNAYSRAHASGPWQFIASTGAFYGLKRNWWVDERRDPIKASIAAAQYLSDLHDYFEDWYLAMASYNCGRGNVNRAIRREGTRDYWKMRTLPKETRNYLPSYMAGLNIARNPEKFGFEKPKNTKWEYDEIEISGSYELESLAKMCGTTAKILKEYNPELRRWVTPPNVKKYKLRVPKNKGAMLAAKIKDIPKNQKQTMEWVTHRVKKGQNLGYIAKKYGSSVSAIVSANNIRNVNQLKIGQYLKIPKRGYYNKSHTSFQKSGGHHVVKKGETLYDIAQKYGVSLSNLRSRNNLYGRRFIYPGQKLYIPGLNKKADVATSKKKNDKGSKKIIHVVQKGESLSEIANKYQVSLSKVRYWNNIYGRKFIYPGQKVTIYQ